MPLPKTIVATSRRLLCLAALLATAGCSAQPLEPLPKETVEVPASGEGEAVETITVDPNVVSYDDYRDPLEPVNRAVFGFNGVVTRYLLLPAGRAYAELVPDVVDRRVDGFFKNAAEPISVVNNLFQGELRDSGTSLARFGINTTVGLLGLFDPALDWFGIERKQTDFAATLANYDVGYGVYLVLPFFGPSDSRNAAARGVDYFLHPIPYLLDDWESFALLSFGFFEEFAQNAEEYARLVEQSEDPYTFLRNLHLQSVQRDAAYRE